MAEKDRLPSVIGKSQRYGFLPGNFQNAVTLLNPWNLIYLDVFVQIPNMFCFTFSHLKRPPAIIYGNGLTTFPLPNGNNFIRKKILYRMLFNDSY